MTTDGIMYVFSQIFAMFTPVVTVLVGMVAAALGLRWVIRVFMK